MILSLEHGRPDYHLKRVGTSLHDGISHVVSMFDQHIVSRSDMNAIEPDLSKAVNAAEKQPEPFSLIYIRCLERLGIAPLEAFPFSETINVAACHRIVSKASRNQVQFNISRNYRRNCLRSDVTHLFR